MKSSNRFIRAYKSHPYNPALKGFARRLRNNSTLGEVKFWTELLSHRKSGYQFYRQRMILNYIVDFYCPKLKLVIEIDGTSHLDKKDYDERRDNELKELGLKIIRYDDLTIINNFESIEKNFYVDINNRAKELGLNM